MAHMLPFGIERDDKRCAVMLSDTGPIPLKTLPHALQMARQLSESSWPPTCGDVIRCAVKIEQEENPTKYRTALGQMRSPGWLRALRKGKILRAQTSGW